MLLVSSGRLNQIAKHSQKSRDESRSREGTFLPNIGKGRTTQSPDRRRGSHARGIDPAILDALYSEEEEKKEEEQEEKDKPEEEEEEVDEELERAIASACIPSSAESGLSEEKKGIIHGVREELRVKMPNKVQVLTDVRRLIEVFAQDAKRKDAQLDGVRKDMRSAQEEHAAELGRLQGETDRLMSQLSAVERQLLGATHQKEELQQHVQQLEQQLETVSAVGLTAEEAARTATQLAKARASIDTYKKQMAALEDKALQAEQKQRLEEADMREKKQQMQQELKETLKAYGPDKVKELTEKLEEARTELALTKSQLKTSTVAQKQQHKLVVSWRIKVEDITKLLAQQEEAMAAQARELDARAETIKDLKTQLSQAESDVKKTMNQLQQMNRKVNEYLDKYTRQAAYIKQQEAVWKAAEAQRMLDEMDEESDPEAA